MTGPYHLRTRVIDTYCGRSIIDPTERTLAHALSENGYRCGAFGKWHLGDCYPSSAVDMGFEETVMHYAGGIGQPGDHPDNNARAETTSYFDPILFRNGEPEQFAGYCTDIFAEEAMRFISANRSSPFFAYVATNAPHNPFLIGDEWSRKYLDRGIDETHAKIYGMVENIDFNVGRILSHLESEGRADNTIFLFTSDHGPCPSAESPTYGTRWNANLRGLKGTLYQGGVKVLCLIHHPGAGLKTDSIRRVSSPIDMMPTLLDFCGIEKKVSDPELDGVPVRGLLSPDSDTPPPPEDRQIFMQWHRGDVPISHRNSAVIGDRYQYYTPDERSPGELYDLIDDPEELHDLAMADPERAGAMRADYDVWLLDMVGTRGIGTFDCQPIHIGSEAENPTLLTTTDWRLVTGEGWDTTDLRRYWRVKNLREADYRIRLRCKRTPTIGPFFLWTTWFSNPRRSVRTAGWPFPRCA